MNKPESDVSRPIHNRHPSVQHMSDTLSRLGGGTKIRGAVNDESSPQGHSQPSTNAHSASLINDPVWLGY